MKFFVAIMDDDAADKFELAAILDDSVENFVILNALDWRKSKCKICM